MCTRLASSLYDSRASSWSASSRAQSTASRSVLMNAKLSTETAFGHENFPADQPSTCIQKCHSSTHDDDMSTCPVIHGGEEGPKLDFGGTTPYEDYVHASVLHTLQKQASDDPREMSFLVITQIMELYFGLLVFEWRQAQRELRADDLRA